MPEPVARKAGTAGSEGRRRGNAPPLPDWRIWFAVLEEAGLAVQLVNSSQARNLPGRPKTGKEDARWIARLTEMGMLRFGPQHAHAAASLRATGLLDAELRDLQERVTAHLAAIPASWGVDAGGVTGPEAGRAHDAAALPAAGRLDEIPGLGREAAAALIAEIGLDMSRFPAPQALVSWAGLTPAARQSGPRKGRGKKGHGSTYAKRIAVLAACAAANTDTFLGERLRRLASRPGGGGRKKAGCAVGRSILGQVAGARRCRAPAPSEPDLPVIPASGSSRPLRTLRVAAAALCSCAAGP